MRLSDELLKQGGIDLAVQAVGKILKGNRLRLAGPEVRIDIG